MVKSSIKAISDLIGHYSPDAIHAVFGASQVGKTTLFLEAMYDLSHQMEKPVLLYDTEGGLNEFNRMWKPKWGKKYPKAVVDVRKRRHFISILRDHGTTVHVKNSADKAKSLTAKMGAGGKLGLTRLATDMPGESPMAKLIEKKGYGAVFYDSITMPMKFFGSEQQNFPARSDAQGIWFSAMQDLIDDCDVYVIASHHACHDKHTYAVTETGPKPYWEISRNDKVMALDADGNVVWDSIGQVYVFDYKGKMHHIKGEWSDQVVTPNHDVLRHIGSRLSKTQARKQGKRKWKIPLAAKNGITLDSLDASKGASPAAYLMGRFVRDGYSYRKSPFANIRCDKYTLRDTMWCLERSSIPYTLRGKGKNDEDYTYEIVFDWRDVDDVMMPGSFYGQLHSFMFGKGMPKQRRVPEWVRYCPEIAIKMAFLAGYGGQCLNFTCDNDRMMADLIRLGCEMGWGTYVSFTRDGDRVTYRVDYDEENVSVAYGKEIEYEGRVWCLTTKTGNFAVMRNGRVCFSGNSKNPTIPSDPEKISGGSKVQYYSKVILHMKRWEAKGIDTYRTLKLYRYFTKPPNVHDSLVKFTDDGYVTTDLESMEKERVHKKPRK